MRDTRVFFESYVRELSAKIARAGRLEQRLLTELRDHLEDSTAAHVATGMTPEDAARRAIELAGPAAAIAEDWDTRRDRRRRRQRKRAGAFIGAVASATALAAAQHAQGRHTPPQHPCATTAAAAASSCRRSR